MPLLVTQLLVAPTELPRQTQLWPDNTGKNFLSRARSGHKNVILMPC